MTTPPPTAAGSKGDKGEKGNQGNRGAKGSIGHDGPIGDDGPPADLEELKGLASAITELAQAATSLAESNERMATNFVEYAQSNARRIRVVVAALLIVIIGIGFTLWGVKVVHDAQVSNSNIIKSIHNTTGSKSPIPGVVQTEINGAVACTNNHTDRALAMLFDKPVPPVLAGCTG